MMSNPLIGAWERVSDSDVGVLIYTDSHYAGSRPLMTWHRVARSGTENPLNPI